MSKMFKVDDGILRAWLLPKVTHTNYSNNEMMVEYLTAQLGGYQAGCLNDLLFRFLHSAGYSSYGCVGDMLNRFVSDETGIADISKAYISFFLSASTSFSTSVGGIDTYTKLMLHGDGTDASTTITDSELTPKTVTAVGNAQIDTAQSKFGTGSILFDGTGDYLSVPDSADWAFGTGDFTIDFWVRFAALSDASFFDQGVDADNFTDLWYYNATNTLYFDIFTAGAFALRFTVPFIPSIDTWYHIAYVRSGNTWYVFIDGTEVTKTLGSGAYTASVPDRASIIRIGEEYHGILSSPLNGWLDEYRISKGIARWTTNFTPNTEAYSE